MAVFSLRTAAQQTGTSKSTILRAVKSGRLSASRTADGGYEIDGAELFRVYPPKTSGGAAGVAEDHSTHRSAGHGAPGNEAGIVASETVRLAVMEADLRALKAMVEELRTSRDLALQQSDQWRQQAERVTLALAAPARAWWKRLAG